MQVITRDYQGFAVTLKDDGWFNATQAAAKFGKRPNDWLVLQGTKDYIEAFKRHNPGVKRTHFAKKGGDTITSNSGNAQTMGTWLHPKLAVSFARWLDADFAVWCDAQIDGLIRGKDDWRKLRHSAASSSKVQSAMLQEVRQQIGKATAAHHHMNEHKLINSLLTGEYKGLDRESLTAYQLDFLAHFELRNAVFIGMGLSYEQRKGALKAEAMEWAGSHAPAIESVSEAA